MSENVMSTAYGLARDIAATEENIDRATNKLCKQIESVGIRADFDAASYESRCRHLIHDARGQLNAAARQAGERKTGAPCKRSIEALDAVQDVQREALMYMTLRCNKFLCNATRAELIDDAESDARQAYGLNRNEQFKRALAARLKDGQVVGDVLNDKTVRDIWETVCGRDAGGNKVTA